MVTKHKLLKCDPPVMPPGPRPSCDCVARDRDEPPTLHTAPQDTDCEAWQIVVENIQQAKRTGEPLLEPLAGLDGAQREQIVSLPASIGELTEVTEVRLYSSHLTRLPPEIGRMTSLEYLDVYTSYRLHFLPYELTHCHALKKSRMSTRALYGNYKHRPMFPALDHVENSSGLALSDSRSCSVCGSGWEDGTPLRRWITLNVGTDVVPLLVNACSIACIESLPAPPENYVGEPHMGGRDVEQPSRGMARKRS